MAGRQGYVLDASIAVKWHLDDEEHTDRAAAVLADYRYGRVALIAPEHIRYEVPNAIRVAARSRRLSYHQGRAAIGLFFAWRVPTSSSDGLILAAYDIAERVGCAFDDGLYLALAEATGYPLIHADRLLQRLLGSSYPLALWIGDYLPWF